MQTQSPTYSRTATVDESRPGALILVGVRNLNKRTCLFFEGLLDSGYEPAVVCPPRGNWSSTRFEDQSIPIEGGKLFLNRPGAKPKLTNANVVVCLHWAMLPFAVELARINKAPLIYDEHDFYELNTLEGDGSGLKRRVYQSMVAGIHKFCLPAVDQITCIHMAKGVLKHHLQRFNSSVLELHNYPTSQWLSTPEATVNNSDQPICFVFVGGVWDVKGCRTVADAYRLIREQAGSVERLPELHFFGSGDTKLMEWLSLQAGIHVHAETSPDDVRAFFSKRSCVGLMLYEDGARYRILGTNSRKMYEYLAAGAAIVATALGEIRAFLRNNDVGYIIRPNPTADELAALFTEIISDPAGVHRRCENAIQLMSQHDMSWEYEWNKLVDTGILNRAA